MTRFRTVPRLLAVSVLLAITPALHAQSPIGKSIFGEQSAPDSQVKIYTLQHADAAELAVMLKELFRGDETTIAVDARTNSVIARGRADRLGAFEALIARLDEPAKGLGKTAPGAPPSIPGIGKAEAPGLPDIVPDGDVGVLRQSYANTEQQAAAAAARFRQEQSRLDPDHPELKQLKDALRNSVQRAFDARQQLQLTEIKQMRMKLAQLESRIAARERIKDAIIDHRVDELLNPDLRWDEPTQSGAAASLGQKVESAVADREATLVALQGTWVLSRTKNDPQPQTLAIDKSTWRLTDADGETLTGTARLQTVGRRRVTLEFVEDNGALRTWSGSYEIDESVLAIQFEVETRRARPDKSPLDRPDEMLWHWSGLYQRAGGSDVGFAPRPLDAKKARALCEMLRQRQELVEKAHLAGEASLLECLTAAKDLAEAEAAAATSSADLRQARQRQVDLLKHMRATVDELYENGKAKKADVLSVEAELLKAEAELKHMERTGQRGVPTQGKDDFMTAVEAAPDASNAGGAEPKD